MWCRRSSSSGRLASTDFMVDVTSGQLFKDDERGERQHAHPSDGRRTLRSTDRAKDLLTSQRSSCSPRSAPQGRRPEAEAAGAGKAGAFLKPYRKFQRAWRMSESTGGERQDGVGECRGSSCASRPVIRYCDAWELQLARGRRVHPCLEDSLHAAEGHASEEMAAQSRGLSAGSDDCRIVGRTRRRNLGPSGHSP